METSKLDYLFHWCSNRIRNGLWPTHVYNLGVGVAFFSTSMIGNWNAVQPLNRQLWALDKILHLPDGINVHPDETVKRS
jgi:hypothetical protein